MNSREKLLASIVGCSLLLLAVYMAWSSVSRMYQTRNATLTRLKNEVDKSNDTILKGKRAVKKIAALKPRSMPSDLNTANTLYRGWLLKVSEEVGVQKPLVLPSPDRGLKGEPFRRIGFQFNADATLQQATDLLVRFYEADELHRITRLSLKPRDNTKLVEVQLALEAIALDGVTDKTTMEEGKSDHLAGKSLEDYTASIVARNLFAPANQTPKLAKISNITVDIGDSVDVTAKAEDPDKFDSLQYALEGDVPEGMKIDPKSGKLKFRPREEGTVKVQVRVSDDGSPSLSDLVAFEVRAKEPPKRKEPTPKPEFDESKFAYTMGTYESNGEPTLWILVRTSGKRLKVKIGEEVEVGTFKGTVSKIDLSTYEFETENGKVQVNLGESLSEAREIGLPIQAAKLN